MTNDFASVSLCNKSPQTSESAVLSHDVLSMLSFLLSDAELLSRLDLLSSSVSGRTAALALLQTAGLSMSLLSSGVSEMSVALLLLSLSETS